MRKEQMCEDREHFEEYYEYNHDKGVESYLKFVNFSLGILIVGFIIVVLLCIL